MKRLLALSLFAGIAMSATAAHAGLRKIESQSCSNSADFRLPIDSFAGFEDKGLIAFGHKDGNDTVADFYGILANDIGSSSNGNVPQTYIIHAPASSKSVSTGAIGPIKNPLPFEELKSTITIETNTLTITKVGECEKLTLQLAD